MNRRKYLAALGVLGSGTAAAMGTGAFTSTSASRDVSVSVADDTNGYLGFSASPNENGEFASVDTSSGGDGEIALDFGVSDGGGSGVGLNSTYNFDDVFRIENQGTQTIYVWANFSGEGLDDDDIWFYPGSDSDRELNDGSNSVVTLTTGQQVNVGVHIDTSEALSSTDDQALTASLTADVDVPGGSQPSGPAGEDAAVVSKDADTGEFSLIQNAIDSVDGTRILVEPGTYDESVTIDVDGLTLEGPNAGIDGDSDARGDEASFRLGGDITADGVTVDGFELLSGPNAGSGGSRTEIEGANTVIRNSDITIPDGDAPFRLQEGADGSLITQSRFADGNGGNFVLNARQDESTAIDSVEISDNTFQNISGTGTTAIQLNGFTNADISGNVFDDIGEDAVRLAGDVTGTDITNNEFTAYAQDSNIAGGSFSAGALVAVDLSGAVNISGNQFNDPGGDDVYVQTIASNDPAAIDLNTVLDDNTFDSNAVVFDGQIIPEAVAPTLIEDWNDLDDIRTSPGGDFALINDLDEDTAGYSDIVDPDGAGFNPMTLFYGTFDGNGHVIRDLVIDTGGFGGLFEQTGASGEPGEIRNLGLENVDVSGTDAVGALVGANSATITNVYVTGEVQGGDGTPPSTGGLVGQTDGDISQSFSAATVTGPDNVGGLVGKNEGVTIEKSYATGDIDVTGEFAFGGGLVGNNNFSGSVVTNSYATGQVSAGLGGGGLVGNGANGELKDSYWDKGTTNQGDAVGPGGSSGSGFVGFGSTGDTAPANKMTGDDAPDNMGALDFGNTWDTVSGDYPILQSIDQGAQ